MDRLNRISINIKKPEKNDLRLMAKIGEKRPDDVVIVAALRTPITRKDKGGLNLTKCE